MRAPRRLLRAISASVSLAAVFAVAAPAAGADPYYVPTHLPRHYQLLVAAGPYTKGEYAGMSTIGYVRDNTDQPNVDVADEPELEVLTHTHGSCCYYDLTTRERPIRIRGHRGTTAKLVDGSAEYGQVIVWEERPGVKIEVASVWSLPHGQLKDVAEDVATVSERYWRRLVVGTTLIPSEGALRRRPRRVLDQGTAAGHAWVFRARIPRGWPLGWYDFRVPCPELSYRGRRILSRWECELWPGLWRLLDDQIFVYGVFPSLRVGRVRIRDQANADDPGVVVPTHLVTDGKRRFTFYVAAMPRDTCWVTIERVKSRRLLAGAGPGYDAERKRCSPGGMP